MFVVAVRIAGEVNVVDEDEDDDEEDELEWCGLLLFQIHLVI